MTTSQHNFIRHEIAVWGEGYVFDLLERGFEPIELTDSRGNSKWSWLFRGSTSNQPLHESYGCAIVAVG